MGEKEKNFFCLNNNCVDKKVCPFRTDKIGIEGQIKKVMVVEDEKTTLSYMKFTLGKLGFNVTGHLSGKDALEAFDQFKEKGERIDLVFTDWNMPGMSGLELANEIVCKYPEIPIVLVTAEILSIEKCREIGKIIKVIISKPFTTKIADIILNSRSKLSS